MTDFTMKALLFSEGAIAAYAFIKALYEAIPPMLAPLIAALGGVL